MTSAAATPNSVEATTALLQTELPRLEAHQQALEKELAGVTERLESVRSALSALQALSVVPRVLDSGIDDEEPEDTDVEEASVPVAAAASRAGRVPRGAGRKPAKRRGAAKRSTSARTARIPAPTKSPDAATDGEAPSGLTRQVLAVLADANGGTVRARDVAKVLGRDGSPGDINAVRSTLDRLVATSRADRAGRGLYSARA